MPGGGGGSTPAKPKRALTQHHKPTPLQRAYARLGEAEVKRLQSTFRSLDSKWKGSEHDQAEESP
ncbi:hypothetical protein GN958_ATG04579 [Phytophthora infestans]|uniref:Uncharacterized protein n=1 Tax=Phytophthora infestans TaxID=4787 RepID=A0A8S9V6T2_PHYIN|nr:hypothetical protein GN958_ATG17501 [Phytophthora infestans]KAF4146228.1 hypothetical protein GN958_ATG04579 [Phytophthora infestans]